MSTAKTASPPEIGTVLHALKTIGVGPRLVERGMTFNVDELILRNDLDRNGASSLARLLGAGALGFGEFPSDLDPWEEVGDNVWTTAYVIERKKANDNPFPADRDRARAALHERFGFPPDGWIDPVKHNKWAV